MKRKKSLLGEALAVAVLMLLLPSLLSFLFFYHTVPARMEDQAVANVDFYIAQVQGAIAESMELTQDVAFNMVADDTLQDLMRNPSAAMSSGREALLDSVGSSVAFQSIWNSHFLSGVYLFRNDGQFVAYSPKGTYNQEQRRLQEICQETMDLSSARTLYRPKDSADGYAYFIMNYENIDTLKQLGKLVIELNTDALIESDDLTALYGGTCLLLTDGNGNPLYGQGERLETMAAFRGEKDVSEFLRKGSGGLNDDYYHVSRQIGKYQMRLDIFVPLRTIYGSVWETSRLYLTFGGIILLLTVLAGVAAYWALLRPLRDMERTLGRLAASDYSARMPESKYRELSKLQETFNRMADNLNASFNDAYQKGIQLQESESRLLSAQINPHFIFNVMETINMRCVDAGLKDISRMVTDMAQLLRGNIGVGSSRQKITFAQELEYVHYYLELQQSRFGDGLSWSVEYEDEELLGFYLPRLTLQPLVENAIVHGLEPRRGLGSVSVRLWEEENSVYVRIEDNGVGFDPDGLELSGEADDGQHNHIALPNILQRLRLLYGDRASLDLHSAPGTGTTALLILPIDRGEE